MINIGKTAAAMLCLIALAVGAAAEDLDIESLLKETQQFSKESKALNLIWWVPVEYWEASLREAQNISTAEAGQIIGLISQYTILVIVDGKMGVFGGVNYKSEDTIRANSWVLDSQGKRYAPLNPWEIDVNVQNMLQMMRPMFASMMGAMGQNMNFIVFPGKSDSGEPLSDAKGSGHFRVAYYDREFRWRLPLDALLPAWTCDSCKEACKGSWAFCPWCGAKSVRTE